MIVASLLDAGASEEALREAVRSLGLSGFALSVERTQKQGLAAVRFDVRLDPSSPQPHRHLHPIVEMIRKGKLSAVARDRAIRVFERLAEAEAAVHGTTVENVHFHEVGALDAIIDVVGAVVCLAFLGVERVVCSAIPVGSGTIECAHGVLPIPAPATARLLQGVPIAACPEPGELTTPTGAALLTTLAAEFGPMPAMCVSTIGYGAGTREGKTRPNLLRVFVGESEGASMLDADSVVELQTNLDDAAPQVIAHAMERLLAAGALDVFAVPIHMKKGRLGTMLSVLCRPADAEAMERIIFAETPTLGIRRRETARHVLPRRIEAVETAYGSIRVKVATFGPATSASPEFDDCRQAAIQRGVPLRDVLDAARDAWNRRQGESRRES